MHIQNNFIFMSSNKILRCLSNLLKKMDLFPADQFIRFRGESQYTTATGGFFSVVLIGTILAAFLSKGFQTVNRENITSSSTINIQTDPESVKVTASKAGRFMFAIGVYGLDLNSPSVTYFDVSLYQGFYTPIFNPINETKIPLEKCTQQHFSHTQQTLKLFKQLDLSQAKCPPLNYDFTVGGRITSNIFSQLSAFVSQCTNLTASNCVPSSFYSQFVSTVGRFTLIIPVINNIINPNEHNYVQTFIEDRNYYEFSTTFGITATAQIQKYTVTTDNSILPYAEENKEEVTAIPELLSVQSIQVTDGTFARVFFRKSSTKTEYFRSFDKIDAYFSYVGGLLGSALVAFFLLRMYSQKSFLVSLSDDVLINNHPQFSFRDFNFFSFIALSFKGIVQTFKCKLKWQKGDFYDESMEEIEKQLDIGLILKKIIFIQNALSTLFSKHQLEALYLNDKNQLETAQKNRKKLLFPKTSFQSDPKQISKAQFDLYQSGSYDEVGHKNIVDGVKTNVIRVLQQSKHDNIVSQRIIDKIGKETLRKLGIINEACNQLREDERKISRRDLEIANEHVFSRGEKLDSERGERKSDKRRKNSSKNQQRGAAVANQFCNNSAQPHLKNSFTFDLKDT